MVRFDDKANRSGRKYVQDRRGARPARRSRGGARAGGMPAGLPVGKVGGLGGLILMVVIALMSGVFSGGGGGSTGGGFDIGGGAFQDGQASEAPLDPALDPDADTVEYMGALMGDIQDVWASKLQDYDYTEIVIFSGSVSTNGCGNASSSTGPFYCPAPNDHLVYVDLDFYDELARRFGAPGDFAQAYVIAHEVGHHIQSITGISDQVRDVQNRDSSLKNEMSVRQELQADCFAGIWANSAASRTNSDGTKIIERGDIAEGLAAAAAVGDDSISDMVGQQSNPHNWTHGSAEARQHWFTVGLDSGDPNKCDTCSVGRNEVGL